MRNHDELPPEKSAALHRAIRLQWISLAVMALVVAAVGLVAGQSQAMRTAFVEDLLALLPPVAFLIGVRRAARPRSPRYPFGHHRALSAGHLVSAVALLAMGLSLTWNGASSLILGERPPIGVTSMAGYSFWAGWPMMIVMTLTAIPAVILGRKKLKLAEELHDHVLATDADMLKADWTTGLATVVGVAGIGVGLWWMDSAAALLVSISIVKDGVTNLRTAVGALLDARAAPIGSDEPHPAISGLREAALQESWVAHAAVRMRDMGHLFQSEVFVVPSQMPTLAQLDALRHRLREVDWKALDTVVVLASALPEDIDGGAA